MVHFLFLSCNPQRVEVRLSSIRLLDGVFLNYLLHLGDGLTLITQVSLAVYSLHLFLEFFLLGLFLDLLVMESFVIEGVLGHIHILGHEGVLSVSHLRTHQVLIHITLRVLIYQSFNLHKVIFNCVCVYEGICGRHHVVIDDGIERSVAKISFHFVLNGTHFFTGFLSIVEVMFFIVPL